MRDFSILFRSYINKKGDLSDHRLAISITNIGNYVMKAFKPQPQWNNWQGHAELVLLIKITTWNLILEVIKLNGLPN